MKEELDSLKEDPNYMPTEKDLEISTSLFKRYINTRDKKIVWENIKHQRKITLLDMAIWKNFSARSGS